MNVENQKNLKPGEARCPGPSTKDIILADGWDVPEALVTESYEFISDQDLSFDRYISEDFFQAEMDRMWTKTWQWACREEHIPEAGDFYVYDIGEYSILIARTDDGAIKAYHNACLHRGTQLKASDTSGNVPQFRCPFHGWTWNLDGSLAEIPCEWDFPHVKAEEFNLPEVRVETWGGFVFINMDENAKPLSEYLEVLPEHFRDGWDLNKRKIVLHVQKELPANWKAAQEAFLEAYHVVETHAQALPTAGDANAQYDVFGENVTRFVHTIGYQSPHYQGKDQTQQEILDKLGAAPEGAKVPEGSTARAVAAEHLRKTLGEEWGLDLSGYSDSEMLDSIEYHLFPNMFLFPGVSLPMIYRFRPLGNDVDRSVFDLLFLQPVADESERDIPPEPVRIGVDDSYTTVPDMNQGLGFVYDQDTSNLDMQTKGFRASKKRGETLGNYQEVRIRNIHRTLDRYLNA
ncbi:MAG: aromatic ring-hydroxylating dioxygenase subunit alpha [Alphaproteobacteria bacterium]|nr:aromatic ring-hydroxylating dioxygenase subunit alpha [Alphaproteobacteria bacterium]